MEPPHGGIGRPGHSRDKTHPLDLLRAEAEDLAGLGGVKRASVYRAAAVAATVGRHPSDAVHPARYDVVVLVETRTPQDIDEVQETLAYRQQFTKPTFYRFLQPTLKEIRTTVMPVLYHLVRLRDR